MRAGDGLAHPAFALGMLGLLLVLALSLIAMQQTIPPIAPGVGSVLGPRPGEYWPAPDRRWPSPAQYYSGVHAPAKIRHVDPVYPDAARAAGVHGGVVVELALDLDGRVTDVRVLRGIPGLDQAAIDAARQWEFARTFMNGERVQMKAVMTVSFEPPSQAEPAAASRPARPPRAP